MEKLPENVCTRNYCYIIWNMGKKKPATTSQIVAGSFLKREKRERKEREKRVCKLSQKVFDLCCLQVI